MKKIFTLATIFIMGFTFAQSEIQWEKSFGGSSGDNGFSIQQTNDGGYIIGGTSASNDGDVTNNHGNRDIWIIKINEIGEISSNYEYYKIEDRGAFYTTYQSFTNHDENNFISIGLNVTREKSTHHMKLIQIPFKVKSDFFLIIKNFTCYA